MTKGKRKVVLLLSTVAAFTSIWVAYADTSTGPMPGSVDDPVITKSYFDQRIEQQVAEALNKLQSGGASTGSSSTGAGSSTGQGSAGSGSSVSTPTSASESTELKVLKLEPEQILYGSTGTEIIVRTGITQVVSSTQNGIADVTAGEDLIAGSTIAHNHLLIIPGEGRGLQAAPKEQQKQDVHVMIRGSYLLVDAEGNKVTP